MARKVMAHTTVRGQGTDLWVPVPRAVAEAASFFADMPVVVQAQKGEVLISRLYSAKRTLGEKLAAFEPAIHGGEVMPDRCVGRERLADHESG